MIRKIKLLLLLTVFTIGTVVADEGMWLPSLIHKLNINTMQQMGCELSADDIYSINHSSLKDAIVALDRGSCTAEVVSKDGLLLTNHHCGFGEIQQHSSVEHDYLEDGFWAMSREEELPNPGKTVTFLVRVEDVTAKVLENVNDDMTEEARDKAVNAALDKLVKEAKADTHYEVYARDFFNSNQFFLFVTETFRDVRLVGAPPQALGKFGGDTDNWMWPRHTNDFSMFRIYCGPDGKPADYSEDNVPYQPKHFLPISLKGVQEGDFAMVFGYPGRTSRYKTSYGIDYTMKVTNTARIVVREKKLEIIADYMASSQKAKIQYASKHASSANYYKNSIGMNQALTKLKVIDQKKALENQFTTWLNADPARKAKYSEALDLIKDYYSDVENDKAREFMTEALLRGPEIFTFANRVKPLMEMLKDPVGNKDRIERYSDFLKAMTESYFKDYDAATDQKLTAALMEVYAQENKAIFQPACYQVIQKKYKGDYDKFAEQLFKKTIFDNQEEYLAFLDNPSLKVLEKDMAFQTAVEIFDKYNQIREAIDTRSDILKKGQRLFVAGLMEMQPDKKFYPDANSTMRLTYGKVLDYDPRDGVTYKYYTTTDGYLEKEIPGDYEFNVPARMKELLLAKDYGQYADADGTLHACFITNNDITGGNSGSPVINGKGELIGIAFDGNWEAMSGDLAFEDNLQRCINVDIRFVLWVIDVYAGADHLIEEMEIIR
ncbi:S46 family peptidase [Maribellus sp. CM-23]|uniref:S46 family peptidase n=1 Tax=Maribellus sp. CM-23 TaxID=2781026 RepID=UPI001F2066B4|nr:S46 family peptidase [Maribellus sp. CM-23]MCE4563560.1 S46 family peptidase [Maribellus sp. CM-23]